MPVPTLLARIRRLISSKDDARYDEIVAGFYDGSLRPPATPMTDAELGAALAEFLGAKSSREATDQLEHRFQRR